MSNIKQLLSAHRRFNKLLSNLALGVDLHTFLQQVLTTVEDLVPNCTASILRLDPINNTLHSGANNKLPQFYNDAIEGVSIGSQVGSCGAAAFLNKTVIVDNINTHSNWQPYLELTQKANLHACWSVPIRCSKDQVIGTFAIYHNFITAPSNEEQEIIDIAAVVTSVAIEKKQLEQQLHFAATHDELTKLHNRAYLNNAGETLLALCQRENLETSLLFIDLNKFKTVNDQLGHKAGDELLMQVATIIKSQVREADIAARFGGDEFIIVMQNSQKSDGLYVAKRIHSELEKQIDSSILALGFGISIGVAENSPLKPYSLTKLISLADDAMYVAKKNQLGIFSHTQS